MKEAITKDLHGDFLKSPSQDSECSKGSIEVIKRS